MSSDTDMLFTDSEWLRYTRHIQLPQLGAEGQVRLKQSHVLIVGCGGLGSPVALYLAAAGVGHLTLVDGDEVDITNLQRQILFDTNQLGENKAQSGQQRLQDLNPDIKVSTVNQHLTSDNAEALICSADLVIDCTDNFSVRYFINDLCVKYKKSWLFAAIHQFKGQCALFSPGEGCFRCLFPEVTAGSESENLESVNLESENIEDCNTAGVLGVLPGMIGTFQATEAIKYLAKLPTPLKNTLLLVDALEFDFKKIKIIKDNECPACSKNQVGSKSEASSETSAASTSICTVDNTNNLTISPTQFEALKNQENILILDVRSEAEHAVFNLGGENIPLDSLENTLPKITSEKQLICYCQTGVRSAKAVSLLMEKGVGAKKGAEVTGIEIKSLQGGIVAYLKQFV